MKRRPCIVMGLFLLMLLSQSVAAQTLSFKRIKTPEGSPISGWITDITQDSQGYLWFASSYAIHRYDAYQITTYDIQVRQVFSVPIPRMFTLDKLLKMASFIDVNIPF